MHQKTSPGHDHSNRLGATHRILIPGSPTGQRISEVSLHSGQRTLLHRHPNHEEIFLILSGTGHLTLDNQHIWLHSGENIIIPAGCAHSIANRGNEVLRYLCICQGGLNHEHAMELLEH